MTSTMWTRRKEKTPFRPVAKEVVEGKPEISRLEA
jgi:hypothetical protein